MTHENGAHDLANVFNFQDAVARWTAERENAMARLELAKMLHRMAQLLSRHQPLADLNVDRDQLRVLFRYVQHGDEARLARELGLLAEQREGDSAGQ